MVFDEVGGQGFIRRVCDMVMEARS